MLSKRGEIKTSSTTYHHEAHGVTKLASETIVSFHFIKSLRAGLVSPRKITEITTSLAGISPGTCDDLDDVTVHTDTNLADDLHRLVLCDPHSDHVPDHGGGNEPFVPVYGRKAAGFCLLLCPVVKKVAKTHKPRGGRWAAALTTPYLPSASWARDLNVSFKTDTAQGGWSGVGALPEDTEHELVFNYQNIYLGRDRPAVMAMF